MDALSELLLRCGDGAPRNSSSPIYAVMQAHPVTTQAVISHAARLSEMNNGCVIVSDIEKGNGYEGGGHWTTELIRAGVRISNVIGMPGARIGPRPQDCNTLTEMMALMRFLAEEHIEEVVVVAPNFHLPRVITSFVTALGAVGGPFIKAWGHSADVGSWNNSIIHSQGVLAGTVRHIWETECIKLNGPARYPNLAPLEEVLWYLDRRDA